MVRRRQRLALVEHVLAEQALVEAGGGDRRRVVQDARLERVGELHDVARALHVDALVGLLIRGHVVDRGEMEEVVDRALVGGDPVLGDAELGLGQVARDGLDAVAGVPAVGDELVELVLRACTHEDVDVTLAVAQELLDQVAPDEPRCTRHEVAHGRTLILMC